MAMQQYFDAFGPHIQQLRTECGTVSAIAGIFKAPLDIIADKLRGYIGLTMDMFAQPKKVLQACEALMPHLCHVGLTTADPAKCVTPAVNMLVRLIDATSNAAYAGAAAIRVGKGGHASVNAKKET